MFFAYLLLLLVVSVNCGRLRDVRYDRAYLDKVQEALSKLTPETVSNELKEMIDAAVSKEDK